MMGFCEELTKNFRITRSLCNPETVLLGIRKCHFYSRTLRYTFLKTAMESCFKLALNTSNNFCRGLCLESLAIGYCFIFIILSDVVTFLMRKSKFGIRYTSIF